MGRPADDAPQPPSLGRIVIYRKKGLAGSSEDVLGDDRAAIISGVMGDGFVVHLTVFEPNGMPHFVRCVPFDDGRDKGSGFPKVGSWRWPEKV